MFTVIYLTILLCIDLAIALLPAGDWRAALAFVLLWVMPGYAWGRALKNRWLIGMGIGVGGNVLLMLLLHYWPGPISFGPALILFSLSASLPLSMRRVAPKTPRISPYLIAVLLIGALFRLPNLGYSEFQGDEGIIMVRAAAALTGDDAELFLHQKGPVEILLPMAAWTLGGALDEFWARLPFAWAGLLGLATIFELGRRWFGPAGGLVAGLLLAINGFHVAFGRIVQYQDVVVWMGLLSLLVLDEYRVQRRRWALLLGAAFLAAGALAHYDAILFAPAAAMLALRWTPGQRWRWVEIKAGHYLYPLLVGLTILAVFYVPFVLDPNFGKTASNLAGGRVRGGLHFNAGQAWTMSTVYNSSYYVIVLLALALASLWACKSLPQTWYAWALFAAPFFFYLIIVFDPRTHLYTWYPGAALLAGAAAAGLWKRLRGATWRRGVMTVSALIYILFAGYTWIMFIDHQPEYQRTWPENKRRLYWTTYTAMPVYGRFGFPHRAGWHAIAALIAEGVIEGRYASNEEQEITDFYTRQTPRTHCAKPNVYIVAERVQDRIRIDWDELERDYTLAGVVTAFGEPRIRWYTPGDVAEVLRVDQADYRQWWTPEQVAPPAARGQHRVHYVLDDQIELLGYDLRAGQARPGGWFEVTLYWRALTPLTRNSQVFVHLYDGQTLWAQHDGAPECAVMPTTRWEPGQVIPDPHLVMIRPDTPAGSMSVLVGMYDLLTLERLPTPGMVNNLIPLTEIEIQDE